jgi:hypothetical protein
VPSGSSPSRCTATSPAQGFDEKQIVSLATELISEVTQQDVEPTAGATVTP